MDPLRHIKPAVREIQAYALATCEAPVKINQNENPWDLSEAVKRRVLDKALVRPWARYPDFDPRPLAEALASFSGWTADGILAANGSNELIEALLMVTVGPGVGVVIPEPTFSLYAHLTKILGGEAVRVRLTEELRYDTRALVEARRRTEAPVTIVCSPNNPTGTVLSRYDLERLCGAGDGLVILDEAYHEFAGETAVPLLERHPNLVVLRTFSKAKALAGLRLGYLLAAPELVREIDKARLPYNLNFFTQMAALAALEERAALDETVGRIVEERDRLLARLADVPGVRPWPSKANFVLLELLDAPPRAVFDSLLRRGVLVRDVSAYPMLSRCLRVSVGTPGENEAFLHALGTALGEAGASLGADTGRA
jgi:histidinol-phosphate aminotransferase